jgi:hypothetical protein
MFFEDLFWRHTNVPLVEIRKGLKSEIDIKVDIGGRVTVDGVG